jgi:predicted transcriptional regulator
VEINALKTKAQAELLVLIGAKGKITERTQALYGYGFKPVKRYLESLGLIECTINSDNNGNHESEVRLTEKGEAIVELIKLWEAV